MGKADIKKTIRAMPHDELKRNVEVCMSNGCLLLMAYVREGGAPGWSSELINSDGHTLLSHKEQKTIEEAFKKAPWLLSFLKGEEPQVGGGEYSEIDTKIQGSFQKLTADSMKMNSFWNTFEGGDRGFTKLSNSSVKGEPLSDFLVNFTDSADDTTLILLEELINGEWRNVLLIAIQFLSNTGVAAGVLFNNIIHVWLFLVPGERARTVKNVSDGNNHGVFVDLLKWFNKQCGGQDLVGLNLHTSKPV